MSQNVQQNRGRRLNPLDFSLLVVILLSVVGFGLARAGHAGVDKVVQGKLPVVIEVFISGLKTRDPNIFKVGEPSSITIRNNPLQPPMTITAETHSQKKISFLAPDGKKALALPDPSNELAYDYVVTVSDQAEQTADGYVVCGQKIKIGSPIELEGMKYRVPGVVVDIKPAHQ